MTPPINLIIVYSTVQRWPASRVYYIHYVCTAMVVLQKVVVSQKLPRARNDRFAKDLRPAKDSPFTKERRPEDRTFYIRHVTQDIYACVCTEIWWTREGQYIFFFFVFLFFIIFLFLFLFNNDSGRPIESLAIRCFLVPYKPNSYELQWVLNSGRGLGSSLPRRKWKSVPAFPPRSDGKRGRRSLRDFPLFRF